LILLVALVSTVFLKEVPLKRKQDDVGVGQPPPVPIDEEERERVAATA
jgi:hypothetical protein